MKRNAKRSDERPHLVEARIGELTQGSVFSCVQVARFPFSIAMGIVITARCDLAQNKYPVLNFLPAVPLNDWFTQDGLNILIEQEQKNIIGKIKATLKEAHISDALLMSVGLEEIANVHFPLDQGTKADRKRSNRFREIVQEKSHFDELLQKSNRIDIFNWFSNSRNQDVRRLISRLSKHEVSGYYFLESLHTEGDQTPFVCLLRDVTAISRELSEKIQAGLGRQALEKHTNEIEKAHLSIPQSDLSMPISCIGSPTIEHLMQTFSNLFGRIGLEDPDEELLDEIATSLSTKSEG